MKIVVLQDHLRNGGTERQSLLLTRAFASSGQESELVLFRPGGVLASELKDLPHRILQPFDTGLDWYAPGLVRTLAGLRPDVLLCMGRMANCYAGRLQRRLPATAVIGSLRTGKSLPVFYRRSLRQVSQVVANSAEAARSLREVYGLPAEKISIINNALVFPPTSAAHDSETRARLRNEQRAGPGTVVLLCVAMFRPEKNQAALVALAASLPGDIDWQLWLAGAGTTQASCQRQAVALGVSDRVRFLGFCPDPRPLYEAADVALLTSRAESLPNFLIEAQAHGLPCVAAQVGGVGECLVPGESGWVAPADDLPALREAVLPLLRSPSLRERCGARARVFAREAFAPERQCQRYLDLFARLKKKGVVQ